MVGACDVPAAGLGDPPGLVPTVVDEDTAGPRPPIPLETAGATLTEEALGPRTLDPTELVGLLMPCDEAALVETAGVPTDEDT